jgi:hypothetical protein
MEKNKTSRPDQDDSENTPRIYSIVELKGITSSTRREFLTNTMKLLGAGGTFLLTSQLLGCKPTSTKTPTAEKPVAVILEISPNPAYIGDTVSFRGGCKDSSVEVTEYTWSIEGYGPVNYQASFATSQATQKPGTYSVFLQVKSKDGVWSELVTDTLTVQPKKETSKPVAVISAMSPNPANIGDPVSFTGGSSDSKIEITEYSWSIVDYNLTDSRRSFTTSTVTQKAGTYPVILKVKSKDGVWSDPVYKTLTVLPEKETPKPVAVILEISPNPADVGDAVSFRGGFLGSSVEVTEYSWSVEGYGAISFEDSFKTDKNSFLTKNPGTYTIVLQVKSKDGVWSDPVTKTLTVSPIIIPCTCDTVCTCVGHCTCDTVCTCVGHCTCDTVCTCQAHGGTICTCNMVHYWYPN